MDMRTRIERKLDKLMAQKRKNWEIEAKLKAPNEEPMDWTPCEPIVTQITKTSEVQKPKTKKSTKPKAEPKPKRKPRVQMSRGKETQTLLQRKCEFQLIGSGRPSLVADSAGHKLDGLYHKRTQNRIKFMEALTREDKPPGALFPMSIATRLECIIFRVLSQDTTEYSDYCDHCSEFIKQKRFRHIRHDLLLGRLDVDEFAFIPSNTSDLRDVIETRIKWKMAEEKEKLNKLQAGTAGRRLH